MRNILRKTEWGAALLITLIAVYLHFIFFRHAGGFWRDEAGTVILATRPTLSDVWSYLFYDSFPAFWVMVVRVWNELGFGSEHGLRILGLLTGIFVLGALWFCARRLRISFPFFSLLLIGLSPTVIVWGDSMRAWGWGIAWLALTYGLMWGVVELPNRLNVICATLAAIGAVHSTYYNWVMLFALCAAGAIVALRNHSRKRAALVMGIGFVAGVTVIPYLIGIHGLKDHYLIMQVPNIKTGMLVTRMTLSISDGSQMLGGVWAFLILGALIMAVICQFRPAALMASPVQKDLLLFSMASLLAGVAGYFLFLKSLKYGTQPWYYSALMMLAALTTDAVLSVLGNWEGGRKLRLLILLVGAALVFPHVHDAVAMRMTNMDLIAKNLEQSASKNDLIVVNPWYCGINFQYYYTGNTACTTLPALPDHSYHCYEQIKQIMIEPDQTQPVRSVLDKITETLKAGNRVWLVGGLAFPPPGEPPPTLPGAPNSPAGWSSTAYQKHWSAEAGYFVQAHVLQYKDFVIGPENGRVNSVEYMPFAVVQGWKEK